MSMIEIETWNGKLIARERVRPREDWSKAFARWAKRQGLEVCWSHPVGNCAYHLGREEGARHGVERLFNVDRTVRVYEVED